MFTTAIGSVFKVKDNDQLNEMLKDGRRSVIITLLDQQYISAGKYESLFTDLNYVGTSEEIERAKKIKPGSMIIASIRNFRWSSGSKKDDQGRVTHNTKCDMDSWNYAPRGKDTESSGDDDLGPVTPQRNQSPPARSTARPTAVVDMEDPNYSPFSDEEMKKNAKVAAARTKPDVSVEDLWGSSPAGE